MKTDEKYRETERYQKILKAKSAKSSILSGSYADMRNMETFIDPSSQVAWDNEWNRLYKLMIETAQKVEQAKNEFKRYVQVSLNRGDARPTERPKEMLEDYLLLLAKQEVQELELKAIEKKLVEFKNEDEKVHKTGILSNGIVGSGKLRGGILQEIDGMKVSVNEDGILEIDEPTAPYHKLPVYRYKAEVVYSYQREQAYRWSQECKRAKMEGKEARPYKVVTRIKKPVWNAKTIKITYPDYGRDWVTLKKEKETN